MRVGDKVKVSAGPHSVFGGCTGTVKEVVNSIMFSNTVVFDNLKLVAGIPYKQMVFSDDELEIISEGS
jgi:hypothetical protein